MSVIRVSIKDKNTLELQEDAKRGDVIDLSCLSPADVTSVSDALRSAAKKEAEKEFEIIKIKEVEAELSKQKTALKDNHQKELFNLELEKNKYSMIIENQKTEILRIRSEQQKSIEHEKMLRQSEIITLKAELEKKETELKSTDTEHKLSEQMTKDYYERLLNDKQQEVERLRDMKAKLSTKLVGETLETHCEAEFNLRIRPFVSKNVYFEKDNNTINGTKGDYIYLEKEENGVELISIMFEMKNEEEGGVSLKKKNEDHFKKLDEDRKKKNCEYAVLVSMLEPDSESYNQGITDVSYKYEKMYVIRPQFFVPMITLLRNAATNALKYKNELAVIKEQNTDITNFEENLKDFKNAFGKNAGIFKNKILDAVERLEKQKKQIQDIIDLFKGGERQLDWAGDKLEDLSVKRLTKGNPTMAAKFEEIRRFKSIDEQKA